MRLMEEQNWISCEGRVAFRISDLRERTGDLLLAFQSCLINGCDRLAVYLICAVSDDDAMVQNERRFAENVVEALAQELRGEFETNLEIPVCELHLGGNLGLR
jgi:hypothetical protein